MTHHDAIGAVAAGGLRPSGSKSVPRVLAVLALVGTIAACSSSSDDDTAALEAERDAALEQVSTVEAERDAALEEVSTVEADAAAEIEAVQADLDAAEAENEALTAELAAEAERTKEAEDTVNAFAEGFPLTLDASLIPEDLPGTYNISFAEAYCDGFVACGSPPAGTQATISTTPEGFLRVAVPGILDAGLFALEGSLYAITDSFTALPQCNGVDQRARVTLTMYADDVTITEDFERQVESIGASITIDTPYEGPDCPNGLVFYASSFTPVG
jgi:hypothetical protein